MSTSFLLTVYGVVQGVGFRPFAARTAEAMGLSGYVKNKGGFVEILLSAEQKAVDEYIHRLCVTKPFGVEIEKIEKAEKIEKDRSVKEGKSGFFIIESEPFQRTPILPPDFAVCEDCLKEMNDNENRRYRYPFISCTSCGPRYSILNKIPYDREHITMDFFDMCNRCEDEYRDETRRRHAQTISCHDCGPQLKWKDRNDKRMQKEAALNQAAETIKQGGIIAVKGIGGYQYLCDPKNEAAVQNLRLLKGREKKPFAVMFPDLQSIVNCCMISDKERQILESSARPIVLLKKKSTPFANGVCKNSRFIGAFLSYTPLHQLLLDACGALVVTSANRSGEMIYYKDEQIFLEKSALLDGILFHEREIITPLDDSVIQISSDRIKMIRRSRGYVPLPIPLPIKVEHEIFAAGSDLKASFCLVKDGFAYYSQYFGDMEDMSVQSAYQEAFRHMEQLFHIHPKQVACDLHPGYHTLRLAEQFGLPMEKIQHHHAHIASVMAEHRLSGKVLGISFDGTGFGTDGSVWGGEFLLCEEADFLRIGGLKPILIAGGDCSAKEIKFSAYSHLYAAGIESDAPEYSILSSALKHQINTVASSSMGRLFDAVSFLLGISSENGYEGEAAIALENAACMAEEEKEQAYSMSFQIDEKGLADCSPMIREIVDAKQNGISPDCLALGFHHAVADLILNVCMKYQTKQVALSGGVFANELLCRLAEERLSLHGFSVFFNEKVPCNDGGIALGQAYICSLKRNRL